MRCKYCFYYDVSSKREIDSYGMMSSKTMRCVIDAALEYASDNLTVSFQGGEPTMRGIDFFEELVQYLNEKKSKRLQVSYAIQTNGTLIDEKWCTFFAKNNFLVGLSLDGIKNSHNENRLNSNLQGTFFDIMQTADLFDKYNVQYNILTVVNAFTARHIKQIYKFYLKRNFMYQQYIPCLDALGEERGLHDYSLTPEIYEDFLVKRFDLWYEAFISGKIISDRFFENLVMVYKGYPPELCGMTGQCGIQTIIEADGTVYPCDFYVLDEYKLGNLCHDSIQTINKNRENLNFYNQDSVYADNCKACKWFFLCKGGCKRDRIELADGTLGGNYYCNAFKNFYEYAHKRLQHLAQIIR